MPGAAESLFERLDWTRLQNMMSEKEPESLHHDYISSSGFKKDPRYNAHNIAKPLGGFANAEGGVLLYGISSSKDSIGRDVPVKIDGPNLPGLQDAITEYAARFVSPSIEGMRFKSIAVPNSSDACLAVLIPQSQNKPHQSQCEGMFTYYRRIDDDFKPMDHADIEMHFASKVARQLNIFPFVTIHETANIHIDGARVSIRNRGNSPALNVQVSVGVFMIGATPALAGNEAQACELMFNHPEERARWRTLVEGAASASVELRFTYRDLSGSTYETSTQLRPSPQNRFALLVDNKASLRRNGMTVL